MESAHWEQGVIQTVREGWLLQWRERTWQVSEIGRDSQGKLTVDMDALVDIEMSTKEPGDTGRSMSLEELTICTTRHTETVATNEVIKALTCQCPTGRTFNTF